MGGRNKLKNGAASVGTGAAAAQCGGSVEVALGVEDQAADDFVAVGSALEVIEDGFGPGTAQLGGRRKLVQRATSPASAEVGAVSVAADGSDSVKIAGFVGNEAGERSHAVGDVEGQDDGFCGCKGGAGKDQQGREEQRRSDLSMVVRAPWQKIADFVAGWNFVLTL